MMFSDKRNLSMVLSHKLLRRTKSLKVDEVCVRARACKCVRVPHARACVYVCVWDKGEGSCPQR